MRKLAIYFLAAFILTSCDNLKSKSKTETDDTEETTTKKKKALKDDEESSSDDDYTPVKKKKSVDDEEVTTDDRSTDDETSSDESGGWTSVEKKEFMSNCVGTAEKNVGYERAKDYCSCMMDKIEKRYPNSSDVNKMTETQRDKWAAECNNQ